MRKLYPTILIVLFSLSAFAQTVNTPKPVAVKKATVENKKSGDQQEKPTVISVLLEEDFAFGIPNDWTIDDSSGICPWKFTHWGSSGFYNGNYPDPGPSINSTTAYNGFLISDIDSANYVNYGTPYNTKYENLKTAIITPSFDATGHDEVFIEFEQFFRYSENEDMYVSVSNDSTNWTDFVVNTSTGNGPPSPNPEKITLDISAIAGNEATVWVKFWWNARIFYWMLDDIKVYTKAHNDLAFGDLRYFNGSNDTTWKWFYTMMPQKQAQNYNIDLGADVTNKGSVDQTNVELTMTVSGADNWTDNSTTYTVQVDDTIQTDISSSYSPFNVGDHYLEWSVASTDSTEDVPADNVDTTLLEVTDTVYAWDVDDYGGNGFWYNASIAMGVANRFDITTLDTVSSVSILFQGNTTTGAQVNVLLMNSSFTIIAQQTYTLTGAQIGNWATFKIPDTEVTPGVYYAGFQQVTATNNNVLMGFSDSQPPMPANKAYTRTSTFGLWNAFQSEYWMPMIRMNMKPNQCTGLQATYTFDYVSCGGNDGSASISVSGGTPPYSYAWSSGGTTSTINSLSVGTYTVTATDQNGCEVIYPYNVTNPPPPVISQIETIPTCAGDCDGEITLTPSGQSPFTYLWNSNANNQTTQTATGLCSFLYQVTVTDAYNCSSVGVVDLEEPDTLKYNTSFTEDDGPGNGTATVTITSGGVPPYNYQWSDGQTTSTATGLYVGTYTVTVTDNNGCTFEETIVVTDIDEYTAATTNISIYPNPTEGQFELRFEDAKFDEYDITITNAVGKAILSEKTRLYGNKSLVYNLSEYSKGIYFVSIVTPNGKFTEKLILH